jgi:hypothetical protein
MQTNELNEAELAAHVKDACAAPATPKKDVEDAVWRQVSKRLDRRHDTKVLTPAAPRRLWRWWLAASTVAAALLIAVLLVHRGDPSWEMASRTATASNGRQVTQAPVRPVDAFQQTTDGLAPLPIEVPRPVSIGTPKAPPKGVRLDPKEGGRAEEIRVGDNTPPVSHPVLTNEDSDVYSHSETADDLSPAKIAQAPEIADVPLGGVGHTTGTGMGAGGGDRFGSRRSEQAQQKAQQTGGAKVDGDALIVPPPLDPKATGTKTPSGEPSRGRDVVYRRPDAPAETKTQIAEGLGKITSGAVLVPPPIGATESGEKKDLDRNEEVTKERPSARPAIIDVLEPVETPAKPKEARPVTEETDTRGNKEIDALREKARELERKIADAEAATRRGPVPPSPYANLQEIKPNVQVLSGGTQDDNVEFGKFQDFLRQTNAPEAIKQDISQRVMIEVADIQGLPLTNADVRIVSDGRTIHKARTYSNGVALFFPNVVDANMQSQQFRVEIVPPPGCSGQTVAQDFRGRSGTWRVQVPYARSQNATKLDILFCLDCTGSMADEIERIQKTLQMMVAKFNALPGKPQTRWGLVQYRDRGDQYVTQVHDFTEDVSTFQRRLDACKADAGGDEPESVNEALDKAVEGVSWDRSDAIRLVLLVGDAPPHMNYQDDVKYTESMAKAQRRAIKIYPLAASGLNKTGEVIFRQLAQFTLARFLFISYGGSTSHEVSNPGQSNNLDDLIVHIVASEVNARAKAIQAPVQIEDPERWK